MKTMAEETTTVPTPVADPPAADPPAPVAVVAVTEPTPPAPVPDPVAEPSWRDAFPDDLKADPTLATFDSAEACARSYIEVRGKVGEGRVTVPDDKTATPEQWEEFYAQIGRPEKADGYVAPEGLEVDEDAVKSFTDVAHTNGLTKQQFAAIVRWKVEGEVAAGEAAVAAGEKALEDAEVALKKDWGDAYDQRLEMARVAIATFGGEELSKHLESLGLENDPILTKFASNAGKMMEEDQIRGRGVGSVKTTTEEAKQQIQTAELDTETMKALHDQYHPGHEAAKAKMSRLYATAHPGDMAIGETVIAVDTPG